MKIDPQVQTTAKKWTKVKNARAGRAKLLVCPLNIQIYKFLTFSLPSPLSLLSFLLHVTSQEPQVNAQCEHDRQKYSDLYGNPDKRLKNIVI